MKGGTRKFKKKEKTRKLGKGQSKQARQRTRIQRMASSARQTLQRASIRQDIQKAARSLLQALAREKEIPVVKMEIEKPEKPKEKKIAISRPTARQSDKKLNEAIQVLKRI